MEQSSSCGANSRVAIQEVAHVLRNPKFTAAFTKPTQNLRNVLTCFFMVTGFSCPSDPLVGRTRLSVAETANLPQPQDVRCRSDNGPPNLDRNI